MHTWGQREDALRAVQLDDVAHEPPPGAALDEHPLRAAPPHRVPLEQRVSPLAQPHARRAVGLDRKLTKDGTKGGAQVM